MKPKKQISEEMKRDIEELKKEQKIKDESRVAFYNAQRTYGMFECPTIPDCPFCGKSAQSKWINHAWVCGCQCITDKTDVYLETDFTLQEWSRRPLEDKLRARIIELERKVSDLEDALIEINK